MAAKHKYTQGDWGVEDPMDHCLTIVANPHDPVYDWIWVATCDWPDEEGHNITATQVKANAKLIAAAPAMLKALEAIKRELTIPAAEHVPAIPAVWTIIDAAISQALGDPQ